MTLSGKELATEQSRVAGRLSRLFRLERKGGFGRWPVETVWKLVQRRRELSERLVRLDAMRRTHAAPETPALRRAIEGLADEVGNSLRIARMRVDRLHAELRLTRGEGTPTGVRSSTGGSVIGSG